MTIKERLAAQWGKWPRWLHGLLVVLGIGLVSGLFYVSKTIQEIRAVTQTVPSESKSIAASSQSTTQASAASATTNNSKPNNEIWIEVKGAVKQPDVYQFKREIRIKDLIKRAGGLTAAADDRQLNLAAKLQDGQSIYVPEKGEQLAETDQLNKTNATSGSETSAADPASQVDLNHADLTQLQQISGIGPKKAADIIAYREENGGFKDVEELTEVSGIGEKTLAKVRDQICVN
ncbi:helix-hairpin-helix domain-containing protein [Lapidilactobacillus wuchangensis]|uniref:helix-hairpin-helix domain-containing protein n=1 Tax=Lapidilactobacillus wuchangensis TaxID=2486001 RepID=UPI000F77695E|nr:helix-hairpin-helix domain-containing protein [Lapidilactobacillus wuchangensis]